MTGATSDERCMSPASLRPERPLTLLLLGGSVESTNRGVAALGTACIDNLTAAFPGARIIAGMSGVRPTCEIKLPDRTVCVDRSWLRSSERLRARSGTRHLEWLMWLRRVAPGVGSGWLRNRTWQQLMECDAVLDVAGGDSFADTYMPANFLSQVAVKRLALKMGKPLILLPQTYGPFRQESSRDAAREILGGSSLVATRDAFGLEELRGLMGGSLDARFVACPDLAFTLRPMPVDQGELPVLEGEGPLVGLNVSGLLWDSNVDFKLRCDYRELTRQLMEWVMRVPGGRLLLVPHVFSKRMGDVSRNDRGLAEDSDFVVCEELAAAARERWGSRIATLCRPYSAAELKSIVAKCDFFIGARMHACIAAASQAVPTITLAYSKKAAGVMGMAGIADAVVDLREHDVASTLRGIDAAFRERTATREKLDETLPHLRQMVRSFFRDHVRGALIKPVSGPQEVRAATRR